MNVNIKFVPWTEVCIHVKKEEQKKHRMPAKEYDKTSLRTHIHRTWRKRERGANVSDIIYVLECAQCRSSFQKRSEHQMLTILIRLHHIEPHPINFPSLPFCFSSWWQFLCFSLELLFFSFSSFGVEKAVNDVQPHKTYHSM